MASCKMQCASPTSEGGDGSRDDCDSTAFDESNERKPWISPASIASMLSLPQEIPADVVYKQLYQLRITQMRQGVDLSGLSSVQWGFQRLKFSHHIVLKKSPWRCADIPIIFRVTVCKSCCPCQDASSVFLGVYGDQESALLVNDVHEILSGRCEKLSVLRKEDAMFFHHLTARTLDESEGVLLPAAPVLSVLEKLRIDSANASLLASAALDDKKRKRSSTIDILIESSLSLSMTSRDNSSSNGEGDEGEENDDDDIEVEEEDEYDEGSIYSSSSTYRNHAPFSSFKVKVEPRVKSPEEKYVIPDRNSSVFPDRVAEKLNTLHMLSQSQPMSRTRRSNRPRASTFSVVSSQPSQSNAQSLLDNEAERTPMGLVTWLASLEDDDFVAAKLLTEMCSKEKSEESVENRVDVIKCDIPRYRGARKSISTAVKENGMNGRESEVAEPPTQRRKRANSVIEMTRQAKAGSPPDDPFSRENGPSNLTTINGRIPKTYRKDPNWASEGRSRGYVGAYSPAERRRRIERFLEKRRLRVWQKNVKYDVRKNFADSRIRVKGRFVKKEDQAAMMLSMRLGANKELEHSDEAEEDEEKGMEEGIEEGGEEGMEEVEEGEGEGEDDGEESHIEATHSVSTGHSTGTSSSGNRSTNSSRGRTYNTNSTYSTHDLAAIEESEGIDLDQSEEVDAYKDTDTHRDRDSVDRTVDLGADEEEGEGGEEGEDEGDEHEGEEEEGDESPDRIMDSHSDITHESGMQGPGSFSPSESELLSES